MELGWGGFDRAKLDMLILIRIPFSFHGYCRQRNMITHLNCQCLPILGFASKTQQAANQQED